MPHLCTCQRLRTEIVDGLAYVSIDDDRIDLDETNALWLRDNLRGLVEAGQRRLALDMSNIAFMSSTTVETLLGLHRKLEALGGRLYVVDPSPPVAEVFAVLHLTAILHVIAVPEVMRN